MVNIILGAVSLGLLWAIMTTGVFLTYRVLDYADLSVEGSIVMGAAIVAKLITSGVNPVIATVVAFGGGLVAGTVTGILNTKLKIPSLLAGILTMIALYSINIRIMGKANITLLKSETVFTMVETVGIKGNIGVIVVALIINAAIAAALYWFFGTELGCAVRATGDNERMARAQGINTDTMKILALALSNGFVALSGALIAQDQSYADVSMGQGAIVIGLASVIIGEVLFYRGNFMNRLISVVLGAVVYRIIIALVIEMGMNPTDLKLFTAITVAICLALPTFQPQIKSALGNILPNKNKEVK
ncbi:MAG: ABC transporter permease [Oscillospiraceae bacterium]|nr:ABC transporter permease [Oscillospiraceae bacterium]MBQ7816116.1 ABC transporter permease [Oscillospiraceae bacterium]